MKLNKTLGRVATTLVAATMLASVTAVPAFATDIGDGGFIADASSLTTVTFNKIYKMPANVKVPDIDFSFTVQGAAPAADDVVTTTNIDGKDVPVKAGEGTITATSLTAEDFTAVTYDDDHTIATYTEPVTFTLPATTDFPEPGIYKYSVTESATSTKGITMGDAHTLYLYVENGSNNSKVITGVEFVNNQTEKKTNQWINYYKLDGDPDIEEPGTTPTIQPNELTVENQVTGDMANMSKPFSYTVTIANPAQALTVGIDKLENGEWTLGDVDDFVTGTKFDLMDNERLHIYGLSEGDEYIIDEADYSEEGYKSEVTSGNYTDNTKVAFGDSKVDITYTNTREAVSPTGIVMNVAPYVLLVVVAAAGCFVFLRKRRED